MGPVNVFIRLVYGSGISLSREPRPEVLSIMIDATHLKAYLPAASHPTEIEESAHG